LVPHLILIVVYYRQNFMRIYNFNPLTSLARRTLCNIIALTASFQEYKLLVREENFRVQYKQNSKWMCPFVYM
jgi:hypothetical protein